MKKMLFFAALSAFALTSCVNDEDFGVEKQQLSEALRFDAPVMKQTRANVKGEITGVQYDTREDFMIFCKVYKGAFPGWVKDGVVENYFTANGDTAKNEGNASKYWSTAAVYYWPEAEYNLAFAAYSPAEFGSKAPKTIEHKNTGLFIEEFQTEADANEQYDLMYSDRVVDRNKTNNGHSAVPLVFHHALSSIVFSTEKEDENVEYVIKDLKLHGKFIQKGNFNQNIATETETSGDATWENLATAEQADYAPNFEDVTVTTVPTQFTQKESALLLIPQAVPEEAYITVTYDKTTKPSETATPQTMTNTATIKLTDFAQENGNKITTWEMGKRYVYRISFGQNKRIYFEPTTTDWIQEPTLIHVIQ